MAYLALPKIGTFKAKENSSNNILSLTGISTSVVTEEWDSSEMVQAANYLFAIGQKAVVDDNNLKFDVTYKKG